jgi:hypothetical protein
VDVAKMKTKLKKKKISKENLVSFWAYLSTLSSAWVIHLTVECLCRCSKKEEEKEKKTYPFFPSICFIVSMHRLHAGYVYPLVHPQVVHLPGQPVC